MKPYFNGYSLEGPLRGTSTEYAQRMFCGEIPIFLDKQLPYLDTVVTAFFMSTETHAKRFLTVWKRSVSTTLKRSFTV